MMAETGGKEVRKGSGVQEVTSRKKGSRPSHEKGAVYTISIAARLCEMETHTIRWLEGNGFISPCRTEGNQRLFSDDDIELLRKIAELLDEGVNLAGIKHILRMLGDF